jgi:hypothetical protein
LGLAQGAGQARTRQGAADEGDGDGQFLRGLWPGFVKVEGTDTCVQIGGSIGIGVGGSVSGRR